MFFNRQKCTYFKISHSSKFLRWFKEKKIECLKSLFLSFYKNVKGAPISKNSQENLGNEDLGKEKNLNIK